MAIRLLSGALALALVGLFALWLAAIQPAEIRSAVRMEGERWYRLSMEGAQIGYVHTRAWQGSRGGWRFETLTHFSLNREAPVSISDQLIFQAAPPYSLDSAEHWNRRGDTAPEGVVLQTDGATATTTFVRGTDSETRPADWTYFLREYLGLEGWLAAEQPKPGDRFTARMPDFNQGEPVRRTFRVLEKNATGYLMESRAPLQATTIQLDGSLAPLELSMAGVFLVSRASRKDALAARTPLHLTSYGIPLDQRLENPAQIEHLQLIGGRGLDLSRIWPGARRGAGEWRLYLTANPISDPEAPTDALLETLQYPIAHPSVTRLARQAVDASTSPGEQLARLVDFVHNYIAYRPRGPERTVLETITERSGDCTEYANLLTTLARSLGLPARTVMGLAYGESRRSQPDDPGHSFTQRRGRDEAQSNSLYRYGPRPRLAFHAWNEVAVDGVWRAVDPTWNQVRADATHLPMPDNQAALLQSMQSSNALRFRVDKVRYTADTR